jgi:serine/threonine-protein kinase HipA
MATPLALDIYRDQDLVGTLFDENPLRFRYAESWLNQSGTQAIAPQLALQQLEHTGTAVETYFENLLPEGDIRRLLSIRHHATSVFGLLRAVGGDTAGGLSLLPVGQKPAPARYRTVRWETLAESLRNPAAPALIEQNETAGRISLAGVQDKLLLTITADGAPAIPLGSAPSTHILKPDITRFKGIWASALNETLVMRLAAALELHTAEVSYQPIVRACLVKRYDRLPNERGGLLRLHQLDLCQLDGKPSASKYETDGGPSLARCRELLQQNHVPAADLKRLLQWVFFNLYIGNHDSHAKNLSILLTRHEGARLAPFYDLMSTALYPGLSKKFAFAIGGENRPGYMRAEHIHAMAEQMQFKPRYAGQLAATLAERLLAKLDVVTEELAHSARPGTEQTLLERLQNKIASNTKKLAQRW